MQVQSSRPPKRQLLAQKHVIRRIDRSDRSTRFCTIHPFIQPPKSYALQGFSINRLGHRHGPAGQLSALRRSPAGEGSIPPSKNATAVDLTGLDLRSSTVCALHSTHCRRDCLLCLLRSSTSTSVQRHMCYNHLVELCLIA